MARKLVLAVLFAAVAMAAARELLAPLPSISVASLPKKLQELNERMAAAQDATKVAAASVDEYYGEDKYEDKYGKYEPKYEDKYDDKYEPKYQDKEYYPEQEYKKEYYGKGSKVSVKLYEKYRSHLRTQPGNKNTFQFTSELTCQNPKKIETEHEDGIIGFPLVSDRMKLVTVGVCEWTVTLVKEQKISEHASLKGNTNVVCTFTEEAERHCKHAGEVLEEGLTVSGQGLVYNFDNAQYGTYKAKSAAAEKAVGEDEEAVANGLDVYLALINGVVGRNKELKYDNGALQFFFGVPPVTMEGAHDAMTASVQAGDPTGEYTLVFKN